MSRRCSRFLLILALAATSICLGAAGIPEFPQGDASPQETASSLEDRIDSELASGQTDAALDHARQAVRQYPSSAVFEQLLGAALFKKGLADEARPAFRRAIELDPKVPQSYFDLALVELSEDHYPAAVAPLEKCVALDPRNAQAHLLLGRAYHNLNQTLPAIGEFKRALALDPRLPLAHYHLGYAYQSQGDLGAALAEFRKEIELNPRFYDSYWLAGNIELKRGDLASAEALYRQGIALKAEAYEAHYGLGRVLLGQKKLADAEAELAKALAARPDSVEAHYALAETYQRLGRKDEAQREFEECSRLNAQRQAQASGIAGQRN